MKILVLIFLLTLTSFSDSVTITCSFIMKGWEFWERVGPGIAYTCQSTSKSGENLTIIEEVHGSHLSGRNNSKVFAWEETSNSLTSIPKNLASFFPNLKIIHIIAPVSKISASDFKPFRNLVSFVAQYSKVTSLDGDLFRFTPNLQTFGFVYGDLENIGENLLSGLNQLKYVLFVNKCINFVADTSEKIENLKQIMKVNCPPLSTTTTAEETTSTSSAATTTVSTSKSTTSPVSTTSKKSF